jgi:hypothetical protein
MIGSQDRGWQLWGPERSHQVEMGISFMCKQFPTKHSEHFSFVAKIQTMRPGKEGMKEAGCMTVFGKQ